jgi:(2Fe-2S) ferredoxin
MGSAVRASAIHTYRIQAGHFLPEEGGRAGRAAGVICGRRIRVKGVSCMTVITVCVGSACHLKGSHQIIEYFKKAIEESGLEKEVELKGTFCMEKCTDGANLLIDEELFHANSPEDAREIFEREILRKRK